MHMGLTACKQYCLAAGATQGNIAYTQTVRCNATSDNTLFKTLGFENRKNNFNLSHLTNENLVALTYQERGIYY